MALPWTPVRRGASYCSPACGGKGAFGCTWSKFQTATRKAKALAKRMGKNWKPRVWENLGWHWEVTSGPAAIRFTEVKQFMADVHCGRQVMAYDKDPRKALLAALKETDEYIEQVRKIRATISVRGY